MTNTSSRKGFKPTRQRQLFCLLAVVVLSGCGGGSGGSQSPPTSGQSSNGTALASGSVAADVTTINEIAVPPDPGLVAGKISLAGVDTNANGVRDEVERELAAYYGKSTSKHAAVLSFARKLQVPLSTPVTTSEQATNSLIDSLVAFECFAAAFGSRDDALAAAQVVATRTFNTRNRLAEQTRIYDLSGLSELPEVGAQSCN